MDHFFKFLNHVRHSKKVHLMCPMLVVTHAQFHFPDPLVHRWWSDFCYCADQPIKINTLEADSFHQH